MWGVGPYAQAWLISRVEENDMNPIITTAIATQRHHDLLVAAEHSRLARQARAAGRTAPPSAPAPAPTTHIRPIFAFQTWLAAGRL